MERMFESFYLDDLRTANRFVFPPIKLGFGTPDGRVTERQLLFYKQIAKDGPGVIILEPVAVTPEGREHPKQLAIHFSYSAEELRKVVEVIHAEGRFACIHLNHAGAAANPKASGSIPKAPSKIKCPTTGQESEVLTESEIDRTISAYGEAAQRAYDAGFDFIEIQAGHGYLVSQFLNTRINKRDDRYGKEPVLFATEVLATVKANAPDIPLIIRISGNEMSAEYGISHEDLLPLLDLAGEEKVAAIHVGMGNSCFSPPWYFHHGALPEDPQLQALLWVRHHTSLPVIAAGRMGRPDRVVRIVKQGLADLVAVGRPLIADPDLLNKWETGRLDETMRCGYCLQGCLHRLKSGEPLGCNLNPEVGKPPLSPTSSPQDVLIVGGGPAGLSAALYLSKRGHKVTLIEKKDHLGGQFALAWKCPGKSQMKAGLEDLEAAVRRAGVRIMMNTEADAGLVRELRPDLLVWATGALQNIPEIPGLDKQYVLTSVEYLEGKEVRGPRVLVIGAGRVGLEIAEKLGKEGYEVVATKRTDPIGSMMEMVTRKLALMRIGKMSNLTLMPHTIVKRFSEEQVDVVQDGVTKTLEPFQTVILASGMNPAPRPGKDIEDAVKAIEIIGDADQVGDIFSAIHSGYELALKY